MEIELLDEKLDIKDLRRRNKWVTPVFDFIDSEKKSMIIKCSNEQEKRNGISAISLLVKKYNLNVIYGSHGPTQIYVIKG